MIIVTGIPRTGTTAAMHCLGEMGFRIRYHYNPRTRGGHEAPLWLRFCHEVAAHCWFPSAEEASRWVARNGAQWRSTLDTLWGRFDAVKSPRGWGALAVAREMGFPVDVVVVCRRRTEEILDRYQRLRFMVPTPFDTAPFGHAAYGYLDEMIHHYSCPRLDLWYPDWLQDPTPLTRQFPDHDVEGAVARTLEFHQRATAESVKQDGQP